MRVTIPYNWKPRPYQLPAWEALESGIKRAVLVWHRRAGKDLFSLNWLAKQAFRRKGLYWHVFPTYRQGKQRRLARRHPRRPQLPRSPPAPRPGHPEPAHQAASAKTT